VYSIASGCPFPFTPVNQTGMSTENILYTGTQGQIYHEGSRVRLLSLTELAEDLGGDGHGLQLLE
jgi:hypothetical protein